MNREIKFRGLRTDGKGWAIGVPFYIKEERKCFIIDNCQSGTLSQHDTSFQGKEVHYKSVGQFTGLKDKNGVEIYEGDIVVDLRYPIQCLRVAMDWYCTDNKGAHEENIYGWVSIELHGNHHAYPLDTKENEYEVIGNIYEMEVQDD